MVCQRDLSPHDTFTSMEVDPLDRRRLCCCSAQGCLAVVRLPEPESDLVEIKQYRVSLDGECSLLESSSTGAAQFTWCLLEIKQYGVSLDGVVSCWESSSTGSAQMGSCCFYFHQTHFSIKQYGDSLHGEWLVCSQAAQGQSRW